MGDLDLENGIWRLAENKTDAPVNVPLVQTAIEIIEARRHAEGARRDYVFSSSQGGLITDGRGNWNRVSENLSELAGLPLLPRQSRSRYGGHGSSTWTRHDLRRTVATTLSRMGFPKSTLQAVLNHAGPAKARASVTKIYNRHNREREAHRPSRPWGRSCSAAASCIRPRSFRCGRWRGWGR